jgi:predicted Zn-dependent protease
MTPPDPTEQEPTRGFEMSSRRALMELLVIALGFGIVVLAVVFAVRYVSERYSDRVPLSVDRSIGEQSARLVASTSTPCDGDGAERYVEEIAAPLLRAIEDRSFEFHFTAVDNPEVNAFALPGGFVTVNSGLLASAETGEEVAAVLAHEMTHVTRRHGTRRMLREVGTSTLLSAVFGGTDIAVPARMAHELASTAYDRAEESEADAGGIALLVRAGIDPSGMARFFERLAKASPAPPVLLSTHPDPGDRAHMAARAAQGLHFSAALPSPKGIVCRK